MGGSDEGRRALAAGYLHGCTLEQILAAWRSAYDAPTYREGRARLARLGNVIRRLAAEADAREESAADHHGRRAKKRPPGWSRAG
ncbi:hypothetical protein [Methylobacterium radiodurans]|uniref:hypothetical protein n=1 Tax=Methylobacterium radiodurans TaxID=2202828 RepID=UPI0013A53C31|nr:hypothetical protein [Methylobacterium radiodurans]